MITSYKDLAKLGLTTASRFVSAISVILFMYLCVGGIYVSIPLIIAMILHPENLLDIDPTNTVDILNKFVGDTGSYLLVNFSIYFMLLGIFISVKYIHKRPFMSLVNSERKISWSRFFIGFGVYGGILCLGTLVDYFASNGNYVVSFDPSKFWFMLPVILIMTPIQTTTEELVFRGYVIQAFGLKIKNGVVLSLISGALFTLPHLGNPEIYASNKMGVFSTICMVLNYFVVGVMLAYITVKTNSLEAAMGAHAVNNLFAALLVGYPDSALATNTVLCSKSIEPISGLVSAVITSVIFIVVTSLLIRTPKNSQAIDLH